MKQCSFIVDEVIDSLTFHINASEITTAEDSILKKCPFANQSK